MNKLIYSKIEEFKILFAGFMLCAIVLTVRIKITHSFFFLFLVWNLFLAMIPYGITLFLQILKKETQSLWILIPALCFWLLFLPNTPYLISDLQHLRHSNKDIIWYDLLLLMSFVWYSLFIFYLTVRDMRLIIKSKVNFKYINFITVSIFILCGFGIYLGRFLRWNSWDIIQDPLGLLYDIWHRIRHPFKNSKTWLVTLGYAAITSLVFYGMNSIKKVSENEN